jgi:hypothetical protein
MSHRSRSRSKSSSGSEDSDLPELPNPVPRGRTTKEKLRIPMRALTPEFEDIDPTLAGKYNWLETLVEKGSCCRFPASPGHVEPSVAVTARLVSVTFGHDLARRIYSAWFFKECHWRCENPGITYSWPVKFLYVAANMEINIPANITLLFIVKRADAFAVDFDRTIEQLQKSSEYDGHQFFGKDEFHIRTSAKWQFLQDICTL